MTDFHEYSKEQLFNTIKRLIEEFQKEPMTPEQRRVIAEFGESWAKCIYDAIVYGEGQLELPYPVTQLKGTYGPEENK